MRTRILATLLLFHATSALAAYTVTVSPTDAHRGQAISVSFTQVPAAPNTTTTPIAIQSATVKIANRPPLVLAFLNSTATVATFTFDVPEDLPLGLYALHFTANMTAATPAPALRVTMPGPPKIAAVRPTEWFPDAKKLTLTIVGENFSPVDRETVVELVGVDRFHPCSPSNPTKCVRVTNDRELQLEQLGEYAGRQKIVVIVGGRRSSEDISVLISKVPRKWPMTVAVITLGVVVFIVAAVLLWRRGRRAIGGLWSGLLIDPQTQSYSLSALQFYLWTIAAILGYAFLTAARYFVQDKFELPNVPEGLPAILAISAGTTVIAAGVDADKTKGSGSQQAALSDLLTTGGMVVPERVQFLVWTLVGWFAFLSLVLLSNPGTIDQLPTIPSGMLYLMGISSLGYLGGKLTRPAGPVLTSAASTAGSVVLTGRNLEDKAAITIDGKAVAAGDIAGSDPEDRTGYFKTLTVGGAIASAAVPGNLIVVKNLDGQRAEKTL